MGLFDNSEILTNRTFSWALGPYFTPPTDLESFPEDVSKISLFVDEQGTINVDEQLYLYKKSDPIDTLYGSEVKWSDSNGFVKSLAPVLGVPMYGVVAIPWYELTRPNNSDFNYKPIKFPDHTPEGFVPANGLVLRINGGAEIRLPNLTYRDRYAYTDEEDVYHPLERTYIAPPGCTYMVKVGPGERDWGGAKVEGTLLMSWGNPAGGFGDRRFGWWWGN